MIPFYPKFGSQEDAPGYGPSASDDACEKCAHFRNLGSQGYCEKFSFMCNPEYVCDDFVVAGTVKESSFPEELAQVAEGKLSEKKKSLAEVAKSLKKKDLKKAVLTAEKDLVPETKYTRAAKQVRAYYEKEAASPIGTYATAGGLGATLLGGQSLLSNKDKALNDVRLHRRGVISDAELGQRLQEYGVSGGVNALAGAGLGAGTAFGVRRYLKPELMRMGDEAAAYAGKKIDEAASATLKNVDDLATKHREASAAEAQRLANEQRAAYSEEISRKGDELIDKMQKADLLEGTRKGIANPFSSVRDRLRAMNPFSRGDKYSKLNEQFAAEEAAEAARRGSS